METWNRTQSSQDGSSSRWYSTSTWIALLTIVIYVLFTSVFPLVPIAIIAGSMEDLVLYVAPVIGLFIWVVAMSVRIVIRKNRRQLIWTALRYGIIAFGGAGLVVMLVGSGAPGYIRKTEQFRKQMRDQADISAIRAWADSAIFSASTGTSASADEPFAVLPQNERPECMENITGYFSVLYDTKKKTVTLVFGGGFGHWGLTVAPKGTPPEGDYTLPLEDGAWVWHEIQ